MRVRIWRTLVAYFGKSGGLDFYGPFHWGGHFCGPPRAPILKVRQQNNNLPCFISFVFLLLPFDMSCCGGGGGGSSSNSSGSSSSSSSSSSAAAIDFGKT